VNNPNWPAHSTADLIARLPLPARRKLRAIEALVNDGEALQRAADERYRALQDAAFGLGGRIARCDPQVEAARISELKAELAGVQADLETLAMDRGKRNGMVGNATQVLARLRDGFLPSLETVAHLRPFTAPAARPAPDIKSALLKVRSDIGNAEVELTRVQHAPPTPDEIKVQLRQHVQALADKGTPRVISKSDDRSKIEVEWPDASPFTQAAPRGSAHELLAWLFPQQVFEQLCEGADAISGGILAAERVSRIAELTAQILDLERVEESLVEQALAAGLEVHRRPSASPLAVLGLEYYTPVSAAAEAAE